MVKEGFSGSDICSVNAEQLQGNLGEVFQAGGIRGPKLGGFRGQKDHRGSLGVVGGVERNEVGEKKGSRRSLGCCQPCKGFEFFSSRSLWMILNRAVIVELPDAIHYLTVNSKWPVKLLIIFPILKEAHCHTNPTPLLQ